MPKEKSPVHKALRQTHLRAIGKVAASWSSLEVTVLFVIARLLGITTEKAVAVCGSQNMAAWCDAVKKITGQPKSSVNKLAPVDARLNAVCKELLRLQTQRNNIIHAYWTPNETMALSGLLSEYVKPKPGERASGIGMPKRGHEIFRSINLTPKEMLKVAADIEKVEQEFLSWFSDREKRLKYAKALQEKVIVTEQKKAKS